MRILLSILLLSTCIFASGSNDITGVWRTKKGSKIEIYQQKDKYFGKLVFIPDSLRSNGEYPKDTNNPDPKLRNKTLKNFVLLKELESKKQNKWGNGVIYDPNNGKTYKCQAQLKGNDILKFRGFIGVSALGRTEEWTRVK